MPEQKQQILEFIKSQMLCTIATVDANGNPECATVAFSEKDNLGLVFGTFNDTRKFQNIQNNPHVAFAISNDDITVQYEGVATLAEGKMEYECRATHLRKNPSSKKYAVDIKQRFFEVAPRWIRYSDISVTPEKIFEIIF